uniref:DNA-directed RNA polymerase subunit beta' n=1 Tax=Pseudomuriella schumacherensis TaxID=889459 RepID=A0A140HB72_PSESB|nr:beta subunit of RNA polymerase [Pseudomuriella schumacherensis]AMO01421.1 beta subunit of RNA polymerase [Pseudomuriella schumacherensis]
MFHLNPLLVEPFIKKSSSSLNKNNLTSFYLRFSFPVSKKNEHKQNKKARQQKSLVLATQLIYSNNERKSKNQPFVLKQLAALSLFFGSEPSQQAKLLPKKINKTFMNVLTEFYETGALTPGYSKVHELKLVSVSLASPERIRQWAEKILPSGKIFGEVTNANTVHYKTFKPYKGGLFCERIFGPIKDFECACGIRQKPNEEESKKILEHQQIKRNFCPKCDVEYTWSVIRRYQLGYIQLVAPVCHIWYLKANPSSLSILLDIKRKRLESIIYCMETMTLEKNWTCFSSIMNPNLWSENSPTSLYTAWETLSKKPMKPSSFFTPSYWDSGANVPPYASLPVVQEKNQRIDFYLIFRARCHYFLSTASQRVKLFGSKQENSLLKSLVKSVDFNQKEEQYKKNKKIREKQHVGAPPKFENWETSFVKKKNNFSVSSIFLNNETNKKLFPAKNQKKWLKAASCFKTKGWENFNFRKQAQNTLYKKPSLKTLKKNQKILFLYLSKIQTTSSNSSYLSKNVLFNNKQKTSLLFWFWLNKIIFSFFDLPFSKIKIFEFFKNGKNSFLLNMKNPLLTIVHSNSTFLLSKNKFLHLDWSGHLPLKQATPFLSTPFLLSVKTRRKFSRNFSNIQYSSIFFKKIISELDNSLQLEFLLVHSFSNSFISLLTFLIDEESKRNSINEPTTIVNTTFSLKILSRFFSIFENFQPKAASCFKTNGLVLAQNGVLKKGFLKQSNEPKKIENFNFRLYKEQISNNNISYKKTNQPFVLIEPSQMAGRFFYKKFSQIVHLPESYGFDNEKKPKRFVLPEVSLLSKSPEITRTMQLAQQRLLSPLLMNKKISKILIFEKKLKKTLFPFVNQEASSFNNSKNNSVSNLRAKANANFLINNFYCLSSRSTWETNRNQNWNYFIRYNWAPIEVTDLRIPIYKYRTLNPTEFGLNVPITGAGLIQRLLSLFNNNELKKMAKQHQILFPLLNVEIRKLRECARTKSDYAKIQKCLQKREFLLRRLKMIRKLFKKNSNPFHMILSVLPVLPPDLRPILKLGNQIAGSDLNRFYQRIIYRNDRLKKFLKDPATSQSFAMKFALRLLQEAVDNLIQNGKGGVKPECNPRGQPLKSLSESLKGKQGRFRQYLLGKRVDYSGRSVIVVGPTLQLHQCGLPKEMALELFSPFIIKKILSYKFARTIIGAKTLMKLNPRLTLEILREVMQNHPILLNRAPTLHRLGIQAFQPLLIEGRAILLHPLVCPAFNADFDGDQMAVHLPLTVEARAEAWKLMFSKNNLISSATGEPVILPSQDMVLGCYYLTAENSKFRLLTKIQTKQSQKRGRCFSNIDEVLKAYQNGILTVHTPIWLKWKGPFEMGNVLSDPAEIRVDSFGNWQDIREKYRRYFDSKGYFISQMIQTTPGRVLLHSILQKCLFRKF